MQVNANVPPYLQKGDKIAITCPAKKLPADISSAISLLQSWGLDVILGETVTASHHQFAGDDELRRKDFQHFLNDDSVKAIIAARGGYGTVRIIDQLDFSGLLKNPKWVIGFSDITVLHSHIYTQCNLQTIHGQMPLNIPDATLPSLESLRKALFGEPLSYEFGSNLHNTTGEANGILVGGNLTLLVMLAGSVSEIDYTDKILFIEDVGEYYYAIDRMLRCLKRAGKLKKLKGIIVGGFTLMKDNDIPFGESVEEMISNLVKEYQYPLCFNFPAGHIPDNHALVFGKTVSLTVNHTVVKVKFD